MNIYEYESNLELINTYNEQTSSSYSSSYTEHDDSHWDRDEYDDWSFNEYYSTTGGGHADEHSDSWHYDD